MSGAIRGRGRCGLGGAPAMAACLAMTCLAVASWLWLAHLAQRRKQMPAARAAVDTKRDLEYVAGGHRRNRLDLYVPAGGGDRRPLVVWIHGGGWEGGDKRFCPARGFTDHGYVVASVNYRFSKHAVFPAQLEDCKAAIRWLRAHADEYRIDPGRIAVWGHSAGGHLAALVGVTGGMPEFDVVGGHRDRSSRVQAAVNWSGPTDLPAFSPRAAYGYGAISRLIGGPVSNHVAKAARASPVTYATRDDAPMLIVHGDRDMVVPVDQAERLANELRKAGVDVTLRILPGVNHGIGIDKAEVRRMMDEFLAKHLGAGNTDSRHERNGP